MAVIKLTIQPDKESLESTIRAINEKLGEIKGLNIKVDSGAAQATQKMASGLKDVATQAGRMDKEYGTLMRSTTTVDKATGDLIQKTKEYQKTALTAFKTVEDAQGNVTKTEIKNYDKLDKDAKKQAEDFVKLKRYVFEQYRKWDEEDAKEAENLRQMELDAEKQLAKEKENLRKQQQQAYEQFVKEQGDYEAEQHRKNAEAIQFEAEEQANARKEKEQAADAAVQLERQYSNLIRQIENLKKQYPEGTFDEIEQQAREARDELRNLDSATEDYAARVKASGDVYKGLQRDVANAREETHKLDKVTESFWMNIQKFARWYIGGNFVVKIVNSLREALKTMKEVDTELANIQKVTDRTDAEMQKLAKSAYSAASAYGVSAQAYLESAAEFAKAGFGDQAEALAEVAIKTQLVGDVSADVADKFLIASNAAWKMNGNIDQLNKTLDAANIIENNYATSIEKLAAGMPIAASVAANAGMTFEETIAALGTITSVTQETGTKAATALRALILNIIGAVGEYEDGIEVTEESVKSLDGILQIYAKDALEAANAAGTVINPMEAIAALAKASEEGLVNQAELFEILSSLGGKLRTNQLISLVQNYGTYLEMLDKTKESAGSADKEIGIMLDTWEAKTNILKNTWTEFISKTVDSEVIKFFLDMATALVKFADNAGLAAMAAAGLVTIFKGKEIVGGIKDVINLFKNLGTALQGATLNMTAATTALGLMTAALSIGIMVYKSAQQARAEATQKAVSEGKEIKELADKYDTLLTQIGDEELKREDLQEILKKNVTKYSEEYDAIEDVNELRKIGIDLINEETKAKAKQYTLENAGAYRRAERYLSDTNAVTVADMGGVSITMGAREAQAFLEKQIELAQKVESPTKAQIAALQSLSEKYKEVSQAIEDSEGIVEAYTTAQALLNGTYEKTDEMAPGVAGHVKQVADEENNAADAADRLRTKLLEASATATAYDTAIGGVVDALENFGGGSVEVYDAMAALEAVIPGSTDKLYDFDTATLTAKKDIFGSKDALLDFIDTTKQLEFSNAISELEDLADSYWNVAGAALAAMNAEAAQQMGSVFAFTTTPFMNQNGLDTINSQIEGLKQQRAEWDLYIATLRKRKDYGDGGGDGGDGGSTADPELARLQNIVNLRKAELSFLEASGAAEEEINAKRREIQSALHDQAEYMRSIGADEADILALSTEWWNIQKQITKELEEEEKQTVSELDRLKAIVSYEKQELSFLQASGKSLDEINAKRKEIQASLHDQAEYMRGILATMDDTNSTEAERKAYEEEILALSTEWWNIQKQINDDLAKAEEERLKKLEEEKKLQQEMFAEIKSIVDDYYAKLISEKEEELSLEEKILAVQKAEAALANAQRERTVRYYNASTGQWEWAANAKNVKSAQDALKKAQDDLNKYQRDQAWKEFKAAWEYVAEQIKSGAMTFREAYDYMYDAMKGIQDKYGVDLGITLEDSIGGFKNLNYGIDGLTREVADSLGASVGVLHERLKQYETAVGALRKAFDDISDKVKSGEMSMEDAYSYLRDRAKEIADKYGVDMTGALEDAIAGMDKTNMSIDELWKSVIITLMKVNSARWFDASDEEKQLLHAQNVYLGSLIGATYDENGSWYLNGSQLYGSQKGVQYDSSGRLISGGEGGGSGGGGGGGTAAITEKTDAAGNKRYYLYDGSSYDTLEEAVAANAMRSATHGTSYYGSPIVSKAMNPNKWIDPDLWAEYSGLAEADPEYAARLRAVEEAERNGATPEELKEMVNGLYSSAPGSLGYFGAYQSSGGTTGWVKAGYGNANGENLLILNGKLWHSGVSSGTMLQDLWGNRWTVGEDGHTLYPMENAFAGIVPAEDAAAIMDLTDGDLNRMSVGDGMMTAEVPASSQAIDNSIGTQNNGNVYQFGGITIGESEAKSMTIFDAVELARGLGSFSGR